MAKSNPYQAVRAIQEEEGFYGRHNLINEIIDTLKHSKQQNAIVLQGQRRIGKSSLLYRLQRDEQLLEDHLPVYFDLTLLTQAISPFRILALLADTIARKVSPDISPPTEEDLAANQTLFHQVFLPNIYQYLGQKRLLILFDEFDTIAPVNTSATSANTFLGHVLQLIREDPGNIALVFVVARQLGSLNEQYLQLFKGVDVKFVGRLSQQDAFDLLIELGRQGNILYNQEALNKIWALTCGHPYVSQLIGSQIFRHIQNQKTKEVSASDVEACLTGAMESGTGGLEWFWMGLESDEQLVLAAVAELIENDQTANDQAIDRQLREQDYTLSRNNRENACLSLEQSDVLKREAGHYHFTVEFIRLWIARQRPLEEVINRLEAGNPEARHHYNLAKIEFDKGNITTAITYYQQSLKLNPNFSQAYAGLGVAFRVRDKVEEAIKAYEEAYRLEKDDGTRDLLIAAYLDRVRTYMQQEDPDQAIETLRKILDIDPTQHDSRSLFSKIYLDRAEQYLTQDNPEEALASIQHLSEPRDQPIIQDTTISRRLRELWLEYTRQIQNRAQPDWPNKAQQALKGLKHLGLWDQDIIRQYNQVTVDKAEISLNSNPIQTLNALQDELEQSVNAPTKLKELLTDYSKSQSETERWGDGEKALITLNDLVPNRDSQVALLEYYEQWGNSHLNKQAFNRAIEMYERGNKAAIKYGLEGQIEFGEKIAAAYLQHAAQKLAQGSALEAISAYQNALKISSTSEVRTKIDRTVKSHFERSLAEAMWDSAVQALQVLQALQSDLDLTAGDFSGFQVKLALRQAEVALNRDSSEEAFRFLSGLGEQVPDRIKLLIINYVRQKATRADMQIGADILEKLDRLLADDEQTTNWYVNWLYMWAQMFYSHEPDKRDAEQAKALCQKILALKPASRPLLEMLSATDMPTELEAAGLQHRTCTLLADILLDQAQNAIEQNEIVAAQKYFRDALALQPQLAGIEERVRSRLVIFSRQQLYKARWQEAISVLKITQDLGVGNEEINAIITDLPVDEAYRTLKADQPDKAFEILADFSTSFDSARRADIQTKVSRFSRLFAGRNRWTEARQTLFRLHEWQQTANGEILTMLDELNQEHLAFVRAKIIFVALSTSQTKILAEHLAEAIQVAEAGYEDAKDLKLDSTNNWAGMLDIIAGQIHLTQDKLDQAIQTYKEILERHGKHSPHYQRFGRDLYNYFEQKLEKQEWTKARQTLEALRYLDQMVANGRPTPDPRIDGSLQRLIILRSKALLEQNLIDETFEQLRELPDQRPVGDVKQIIRNYSTLHSQRGDWSNAVTALQRLDAFLLEDCRHQTRDQQVLTWLVDSLKAWAQELEHQPETADTLERAASLYDRALDLTRDASEPKNLELAEHLTRVLMKLADRALEADLASEDNTQHTERAINWYETVSELPEHRLQHQQAINEAIYRHAARLAQDQRWLRAEKMLNYLDTVHSVSTHSDRTLFATWRKELILQEVNAHLTDQMYQQAITRLAAFKDWLKHYDAPKAGWVAFQDEIKHQIQQFYQLWFDQQAWEPTVKLLQGADRLMPDDPALKTWQAQVLAGWGKSLQQAERYLEAIQRFEQAQTITSEQSLTVEIEADLLESQLIVVRNELAQMRPDEAEKICIQILQKSDNRTYRSDQIRQAFLKHSQRLVEQTPPNWVEARQALQPLQRLQLDDEAVLAWDQTLILRRTKTLLATNDLEAVFISLQDLKEPWPYAEVQQLLLEDTQQRLDHNDWQRTVDILFKLGDSRSHDRLIHDWAVDQLKSVSNQLGTKNDWKGVQAALRAARDLSQKVN